MINSQIFSVLWKCTRFLLKSLQFPAFPKDFEPNRKKLSDFYLKGTGIEIGALHHPLIIGPKAGVKYVDRFSVENLRKHYPELANQKLVHVDVEDDGEKLEKFSSQSLDFLIANHFLEHCENPLGTLRNHLSKVRDGGILYYAIPNKDFTFDKDRTPTTFQHLILDDSYGPEYSRSHHFLEWAVYVEGLKDPATVQEYVDQRMKNKYSIHFHVWNYKSYVEFLFDAKNYLNNTFEVVLLIANASEVISILRKVDGKQNHSQLISRLEEKLKFLVLKAGLQIVLSRKKARLVHLIRRCASALRLKNRVSSTTTALHLD